MFIARGPEELLLTPELGNQCTAQNTSLCYIHLMSYIHYFHGSKENTFIANAVVYRQCMEGQSYWHGGSSAVRPCTSIPNSHPPSPHLPSIVSIDLPTHLRYLTKHHSPASLAMHAPCYSMYAFFLRRIHKGPKK